LKKLAVLTVLGAAALGLAAYLWHSPPDAVQRVRYPLHYRPIVTGHARNYQLQPALLAAVIEVESKFDAKAESPQGAIGLMQLLPTTAHGIALHTGGTNFRTSDLYDPEINVRYGAWYLRHLLDKYGDERTALAAYNAGQNNVDRWVARGSGIGYSETRAYVDKVERLKRVYHDVWGLQLSD